MKSILTHNPLKVCHLLMRGAVCAMHRHACCRKPLFLPHACSFVSFTLPPSPLTLRTTLNHFALYEKRHSSSLFGGSGGVAWRYWGIAKMAAVSKEMKTVTLRYQSFHSVPCPCKGLLCALCCSHTGAADALYHIGCCMCQSVRMWIIICVTDALR